VRDAGARGPSVGLVTEREADAVARALGGAGLRLVWTASPASLCDERPPPADLVVLVDGGPASEAALERLTAMAVGPVVAVVGPQRRRGVELLGRGADDFVTTSSSAAELVARAGALLRRPRPHLRPPSAARTVLQLDGLEVDLSRGSATVRGDRADLTPRELELLAFLLRGHDRAWSRAELLEHVWGYRHGDLNPVTVHVCHLRRKLGDDPQAPRYVVTVPGRGYRAGAGVRT
jgi:DNA-binding response OmpR family regulator